MVDKKEPVQPCNLEAAPVLEEDRTGPDNALKSQHDEVEKKLYKEIQALVEKYEDSIELLYNERSEIVNGEVDVESNTNETAEEPTSDKKATKVKGIPYFWLTAMKNNKMLAPMIIGSDEEALKYIKDIKCCIIGDPLELKLDFFFDTNPFFTNSILTRTYTEIKKCEEITNAPSTGTKINWFPEKSLTREIRPKRKTRLPEKSLTREILPKRYFLTREILRKRKTRLPKKSLTREIRPKRKTRTEKSVSFFNFFGDCEDGIGHILQNKIIPDAVSWYTGEASETESESSAQEDSDEIESSGDEDENKSDGEASKKRTRAGDIAARKSRRIR